MMATPTQKDFENLTQQQLIEKYPDLFAKEQSAGTFVDRSLLDRINPFTPFNKKKFVPNEKAKQKMMVQAEMMKQLQPTVPEVTPANIDMQPANIPNPKPDGPGINANIFNAGNLYPGISGSSKLAANWNPMMDPAAG